MRVLITLVLILTPALCWSQTPLTVPPAPSGEFTSNRPTDSPTSRGGEDIRVGADDLIEVSVFEIPDLSTVARVTASGTIVLNYVGAVDAAGKTPQQLGRDIETALKAKSVLDPHVTVSIREYASQPVSVIGAVKIPSIYQIKGQKLLLDVLAMAQGLSDSAGRTIQVIRHKDTNPGTTADTITIDAIDLFQNGNTALNIPIYAGDVINVLNAGTIFTVGEVLRPGEFQLRYGKDVTVSQAVALGGGTSREAKKSQCLIIRPHADGTKEQIPVNLTKIFDGSQPDILLRPNDVLFVPANKVKSGLNRTLDSVVSIVIGRAIYLGR